MKEYWIVGEWIECEQCKKAWEFVGLFDSKDASIEACIKENYFIGPVNMNEALPEESKPWIGAYYPLLESKTRYPIDISQEIIKDATDACKDAGLKGDGR